MRANINALIEGKWVFVADEKSHSEALKVDADVWLGKYNGPGYYRLVRYGEPRPGFSGYQDRVAELIPAQAFVEAVAELVRNVSSLLVTASMLATETQPQKEVN